MIIVSVLEHPKRVGGLTSCSNFLRGGGMDVFWNDPMDVIFKVRIFSTISFTQSEIQIILPIPIVSAG
jgi:hypothetical protein